jgi:hypothetical protein
MKKLSYTLGLTAFVVFVFFACKKHNEPAERPGFLTISGTIDGCDGGLVNTGQVNITVDSLTYQVPLSNGSFNQLISRKSTGPTVVRVYMVDSFLATYNDLDTTITADTGSVNFGTLYACGGYDQWFTIVISNYGPNLTLGTPFSTITYDTGTIVAQENESTPGGGISMGTITGTGTYPVTQVLAHQSNSENYQGNNTGGTVTITSFGPVGGYITGTFTSPIYYVEGDPSSYPLRSCYGNFRVRRSQ